MQAFMSLLAAQDGADSLEEVAVEQQDFQASLQSLTPSLSEEELDRYAKLRQRYERSHS